ncbi:DUF4145 domain-containing protein [Curtobacterium sp. MCLR17_058]|uniref:DUF4145 domain-containing protein n=1 Tax=Curtobacterium sp. MCLR17_058 TaxID=2175635 RepID=UPI000DAA5C59|nr:DUF4145 domain-containing protein [Curtobacterium sp. MCLR17_058]WIB42821.1 DUF4145 domain-containing protein [Curtobacterium sp. MCLR17_058]
MQVTTNEDVPAGRRPDRNRKAFTCPTCGAFSAQTWHALGYQEIDPASDQEPWFRELEELAELDDQDAPWNQTTPWLEPTEPWVVGGIWAAAQCAVCQALTIWRHSLIIHPASKGAPAPHPDMPPAAAELYEEARSVVAMSRRAGAAMARATLERLLRDLDPEADGKLTLDRRIERILARVSSGLGRVLDVIRHVGNKSVHVSDSSDDKVLVLVLDEEDAAVVDVLFSAINQLVDELVTKPAQYRKLFDQLPDGVRRGIEDRSKAQ